MASTVGSIGLEIFANVASLIQDLNKGERAVQQFAKQASQSFQQMSSLATSLASSIAGLGVSLSVVGFAAFAKQMVGAADDIGDMAERLGVSTDALQAFQFAAKEVGASAEEIAGGFSKLNKLLGEAGLGNKEAIKTFQDMGVSFKDASGFVLTTEEAVRAVADRIQRAGSVSEATAIAVKALGRGAAPLVPLFRDGSKGIDELIDRLIKLGVIADSSLLGKGDRLQRELDEATAKMKKSFMEIGVALGPLVVSVLDKFAQGSKAVGDFFSKFDEAARKTMTDWKPLFDFLKFVYNVPASAVQRFQSLFGGDNLKQLEPIPPAVLRELSALTQKSFTPRSLAIPTAETDEEQLKATNELLKELRQLVDQLATSFDAYDASIKLTSVDTLLIQQRTRDLGKELAGIAATKGQLQLRPFAPESVDQVVELGSSFVRLNDALEHLIPTLQTIDDDFEPLDRQLKELKESIDDSISRLKVMTDMPWKAEVTLAFLPDPTLDADKLRREQVDKIETRVTEVVEGLRDVFGGFNDAFSGMVEGIVQGTQTVSQAIEKMGQSIVASLSNRVIQRALKALEEQLFKLLELGLKAGVSYFSTPATSPATATPSLSGSDFSGTLIEPTLFAAGGIVRQATIGIVGESGPEAVIPLDRLDRDTVSPTDVTVNVIDQRRSGNVETRESSSAPGQKTVDVLITDVVRQGLGAGAFDRTLASNYGINRRGVLR